MKISIRNFRGVTAADFDHDKITFIGGRNHQGKSSICQAIAAIASGEIIPIPDLPKSKIKNLVRDGAKSASCKISIGETLALLTWPDCSYSIQGPALKNISKISAGLVSILDYESKKRIEIITDYIKSNPTLEDLGRELKAADIPKEVADQLIRAVEISGYFTMHAKAKEKGTGLKAQWEMITGQRYGSQKIESWAPAAYYPELEKLNQEQLAQTISQLKVDLEAGIAASAVSDKLAEQLQERAGAKAAYLKDLKAISADLEKATERETRLQKEFLKLSDMPTEHACPHCGGLLQLKDGAIVPYEEIGQEEVDDRTEKLRQIGGQLEQARLDKRELIKRQVVAQQNIADSILAAQELEKIEKASAGKQWADKVDQLRVQLEKAESDLKAVQDKRQADYLAAGIKANRAIQEILGPDGLRKTKLNEALAPFNQMLSDLCQAASWAVIRMDIDFNFFMNDRPVPLCSKSEQFQARAILQLVLGALEGAQLVLIDGADIIVGQERNGLFSAILKSNLSTIVFMSMPGPDKMPAMEKIGGQALWIEKGEISNGNK